MDWFIFYLDQNNYILTACTGTGTMKDQCDRWFSLPPADWTCIFEMPQITWQLATCRCRGNSSVDHEMCILAGSTSIFGRVRPCDSRSSVRSWPKPDPKPRELSPFCQSAEIPAARVKMKLWAKKGWKICNPPQHGLGGKVCVKDRKGCQFDLLKIQILTSRTSWSCSRVIPLFFWPPNKNTHNKLTTWHCNSYT